MILLTGGAGFIGSNLVHYWLESTSDSVINVDKLTYAGNRQNLARLAEDPRHIFAHADIGDVAVISRLLAKHKPRAILNLAAESHVDRSIDDPDAFIQTNVVATLRLLKTTHAYWNALPAEDKAKFRFLHVSTDEVYGSLRPNEPPFSETRPYAPNNPYSASKAASDHLVRSFFHTYGLPVLTTNCSNNYGPYQFPEKLIPLAIHRALNGEKIPVYGDGLNIRDWLYVTDHCAAIKTVLERGQPGEVYNVGAVGEKTNIDVVNLICAILDQEAPRSDGNSYRGQITFIEDRPGHDRRYAIDATKISRDCGWQPKENFESALRKTIRWYLDNQDWVKNVTSGAYRDWIAHRYEEHVGAA